MFKRKADSIFAYSITAHGENGRKGARAHTELEMI